MGSNFFLAALLGSSLDHLWEMLNSLQVIELVEYASNDAPAADPFEVVASGYKQPDADANCPMPVAISNEAPAADECRLPF